MNTLQSLQTQPVALASAQHFLNVLPATVAAGFPSPAEDHAVQRVDLMEQLIKHPQATFLLRVRGDLMKDTGIFDNDVVLVDRAITPRSGHVVIASCVQQELLLDDVDVADAKADCLMQALDAINGRFGRGTVSLASGGQRSEVKTWGMKQERRTPGYTTDWGGWLLFGLRTCPKKYGWCPGPESNRYARY
jgi:hypothetical protein